MFLCLMSPDLLSPSRREELALLVGRDLSSRVRLAPPLRRDCSRLRLADPCHACCAAHPSCPRIPERVIVNNPGETDQEYKDRIVREKVLDGGGGNG